MIGFSTTIKIWTNSSNIETYTNRDGRIQLAGSWLILLFNRDMMVLNHSPPKGCFRSTI